MKRTKDWYVEKLKSRAERDEDDLVPEEVEDTFYKFGVDDSDFYDSEEFDEVDER